MGFFNRPNDPAEPRPIKPEVVYEKVSADDIFFKNKVEWHRGQQVYLRTECQICGEVFGTCQGPPRMLELKREHQRKCWPCGFRDCIDCTERGFGGEVDV
jgi:hypothetical protein